MPLDSSAATHMRRALELARLGWGHVHPNPMVGAVIVRDGKVIGEGYHRRYGEAHAEVEALRVAGGAARGATLFVTLEPCAHHGKTPPCTDAIIAAGISSVVYAARDPNQRAGGGANQLRAHGVAVQSGIEEAAARELNVAFFHVHEHGAPYVALKLALSADGRIAAHAGARTALTGELANREVHYLRAGFDAILIGSHTAEVDDPLLTVRNVPVRKPPVRVVIDSSARVSLTSQLMRTSADAPVWIVVAHDADAARTHALQHAGARILHVARSPAGIDLIDATRQLADHGLTTIFTEGGSRIATAMLDAKLVQRMYLFITPHLLGTQGVHAFASGKPEPSRWRIVQQQQLGPDLLLVLDQQAAH